MNVIDFTGAKSTGMPTAEPATPVAAVGPQPPTDFLLALAQLLETESTPLPAANTVTLPIIETEDDAQPEDVAAAGALPFLPLPFAPLQMPLEPSNAPADPVELLGLGSRSDAASPRDMALFQALTERLASSDEATSTADVTQAASPTPFAVEMPAHRVANHDAAVRPMQAPVGTPAWVDDLGSRLTMMTEKGQHTASLRLSPEHLGPLEIRISMRDDQASVWFGAAHADTRAAIENALPRLREMFESQGMSLADAGVFREPPRQQAAPSQLDRNAQGESASATTEVARAVRVGLFDAYA